MDEFEYVVLFSQLFTFCSGDNKKITWVLGDDLLDFSSFILCCAFCILLNYFINVTTSD